MKKSLNYRVVDFVENHNFQINVISIRVHTINYDFFEKKLFLPPPGTAAVTTTPITVPVPVWGGIYYRNHRVTVATVVWLPIAVSGGSESLPPFIMAVGAYF
jgi:hypothetical protein